MNRLQKKCFIAATGFHLLLVLILFIGPAFLSARSRFDSLPVLEFVPLTTTDEMVSGGGNRLAKLPPPAPEPPAPQPPAAPPQPQPAAPEPPPPQPKVKEIRPSPDALDTSSESKKHKIQVNTTPVIRKRNPDTNTSDAAASEAKAEARRRSAEFSAALRNIRGGLSSSTSIEMPGPGTGGVPYANFMQAVQSVYAKAWLGRVPAGATDRDTYAIASITIQRDGTVVSSVITHSSGNAIVDRAVQEVLNAVKYAAPLPDGALENQRSVTIKFTVSTGDSAG